MIARRLPKSRPPLLERRPGTFSRRMAGGRYRSTRSRKACASPLRVSSPSSSRSPARFPATLRSWHDYGKPPDQRVAVRQSGRLPLASPPFVSSSRFWISECGMDDTGVAGWRLSFVPPSILAEYDRSRSPPLRTSDKLDRVRVSLASEPP
jgi:hypothetical protein